MACADSTQIRDLGRQAADAAKAARGSLPPEITLRQLASDAFVAWYHGRPSSEMPPAPKTLAEFRHYDEQRAAFTEAFLAAFTVTEAAR